MFWYAGWDLMASPQGQHSFVKQVLNPFGEEASPPLYRLNVGGIACWADGRAST